MLNCFSLEYYDDTPKEEINELIKKEVTLRGLILGEPLHTKFKIIKSIKDFGDKKVLFVFVFSQDESIEYKTETDLFADALLFLEENINALKVQQDLQ